MEGVSNNINKETSIKEIILIIQDWLAFLISRFKVILLAGLLGASLGFAYAYMKTPSYTASLTFALEDEKSGGLGGALGLAGQFGLDLSNGGGGIFAGGNLSELFKSRAMVQEALLRPVKIKGATVSLAEMYIQDNEWREAWGKKKIKGLNFFHSSDVNGFSRQQDSVMELIYKNISKNSLAISQKDKKISIISLDVTSGNEVFSKTFAEALVDVVSDFYIDTKSKKARINMTILQRQLDSIRGELNGSISGVAIANDRTFSLNPALNVKRVPSVRKQVDVQANTAILTELVKQTELAKVTLRKETPLIQVIDKPIYPLKKERLGKLKALVAGGFVAGFLTVMLLIINRIYRKILE